MHKLIHALVLGAAHESLHEFLVIVHDQGVVHYDQERAIANYTQAGSKKPEMKTFEQLVFLNTSIGSIVTCVEGPSS